MKLFLQSILLTLTLIISPLVMSALPFFSSDEPVPSLAPMIEQTTPAVVSIAVEGTQVSRQRVPEMFRHFFGGPSEQVQERPFKGLGSGVIIDAKNGYVVTNNHVVDNATEILVQLTDGREIKAKKLGADAQSDIALLQIEEDKLTAVPLADSDQLRVGDFVVAIGNPFGLNQTVTSGIVSALGRSGLNIGGLEDFIQTDAAINRGNSGGALVNLKGELVGINTAIFGSGGGNVGIGFAIPSNMMKSLVDQIVEFGEVRRGLLGIAGQDIDAALAEAMNLDINKGAFVNEVSPESAADEAGIEAGDLIIAVNGDDIEDFQQLRAKIGTLGAGAKVTLTIVRKGERKTINVVLGDASQNQVAARDLHPALEGAVLVNINDENNTGVEIESVTERSPAARIGLEQQDIIIGVNRTKVENVIELRRLLENANDVIMLHVKRGNAFMYVVIR
jgi:Do/DeqQ family serine protease